MHRSQVVIELSKDDIHFDLQAALLPIAAQELQRGDYQHHSRMPPASKIILKKHADSAWECKCRQEGAC